jgi:hypothetical protein
MKKTATTKTAEGIEYTANRYARLNPKHAPKLVKVADAVAMIDAIAMKSLRPESAELATKAIESGKVEMPLIQYGKIADGRHRILALAAAGKETMWILAPKK